MIFRTCTCCKETLPFFRFRIEKASRTKWLGAWLNAVCTLCLSEKWRKWYRKNTTRAKDNAKRSYLRKRLDWAVRLSRRNSGERLDPQFLRDLLEKQKGLCYWSGIVLDLASRKRPDPWLPNSITLDRLESSRGYDEDNIVLACHAMNIGRSNCPVDKWTEFLSELKSALRGVELEPKTDTMSVM